MNSDWIEFFRRDTAILIPARLDSRRLPGKMLLEVRPGVHLIRHVYDKCVATGIDTYVITDSEQIAAVCPNSILTTEQANNGTERCAIVAPKLAYENFVNVQGDMFSITQQMIENALIGIRGGNASVSTVYQPSTSSEWLNDPNAVKLIHTRGRVHWFCRAPLKYGEQHLGVYAYTKAALARYRNTERGCHESAEDLEQLRWIENGVTMRTRPVDPGNYIEINTKEDLDAARSTVSD